MKITMKHTHTNALALLCFSILTLVSCREKNENEWKRLFGYTRDDVCGSYAFSNCADAFANLEENDTVCRFCRDAEISISPSSTNSIVFNINCPQENYTKTFVGKAPMNANDFLIDIQGNTQNHSNHKYTVHKLQAEVLKNDAGQIRLCGFGQSLLYQDHYEIFQGDTLVTHKLLNSMNYYFDALKVETE